MRSSATLSFPSALEKVIDQRDVSAIGEIAMYLCEISTPVFIVLQTRGDLPLSQLRVETKRRIKVSTLICVPGELQIEYKQ